MTKLHNFILWAIICLFSTPASSQFSRSEAIDLVLNQILVDDLANIDVYSSYNTLSENESIPLWNGENLENPYSSCWYFFVDDMVLLTGNTHADTYL